MDAGTNAAADVAEGIPEPRRDALELNCIFCLQHAGSRERVIYWPPRRNAPGVIAHKRCYDKAVSS